MTKDDLGIKIGTKEESFWTTVQKKAEEDILNNKRSNELNEVIAQFAQKKVETEQNLNKTEE